MEEMNMAQRISKAPVVDRGAYKGKLVFLDKHGYVSVADRPKRLTDEERQQRATNRRLARTQEVTARRMERQHLSDLKQKARKEPSVENAKAYEEALKDYKGKWD